MDAYYRMVASLDRTRKHAHMLRIPEGHRSAARYGNSGSMSTTAAEAKEMKLLFQKFQIIAKEK